MAARRVNSRCPINALPSYRIASVYASQFARARADARPRARKKTRRELKPAVEEANGKEKSRRMERAELTRQSCGE